MLKTIKLSISLVFISSLLNNHVLAEINNNIKDNISSVKANMHRLQTMVETHGVEWKELYPNNIEDLKIEAEKITKFGGYWKEFKNPFTGKIGINGSLIDYEFYKSYKGNISDLNGMVLYKSFECEKTNLADRKLCRIYKIWGTDEKGQIIKQEQDFYLSNN
ncbi:MAG: hypothetical protein U0354_06580 [Candidatus Sericytochromatia bacterium]